MCDAEVKPLNSVQELFSWTGISEGEREVICCLASYTATSYKKLSCPRTLICHDMSGGYLEDRFCNGSSNKDAYRFYNWSGVDGFIYFSHKFITIPPVGWTQAAHQHNVKVYGTLITEWDEGSKLCSEFLKDEDSIRLCISQLVKLAQIYKFEGWLINIENKLSPEQVQSMIKFVDGLTKAMHENIQDSEVIWYDSVTCDGELKWQNKLNDLNKCYFDVSDGIFLNYTWTNQDLAESKLNAGPRHLDVYVGLDVFGRNFYSGGGFNTHEALQVARNHELSAAIFAQGWTYECLGKNEFFSNENKLWRLLCPLLYYNGPCTLPFRTYLCQGFGDSVYKNGEKTSNSSWHNLCKQQYQPLWCESNNDVEMSLYTKDAFNGGSCLLLESPNGGSVRLFVCSLKWICGLVVTMTYKWISQPCDLSLSLKSSLDLDDVQGEASRHTIEFIYEACETESKDDDKIYYSKPVVVTQEKNNWITKLFHVVGDDSTVHDIVLNLKSSSKILIGQISLENQCIKGYEKRNV